LSREGKLGKEALKKKELSDGRDGFFIIFFGTGMLKYEGFFWN